MLGRARIIASCSGPVLLSLLFDFQPTCSASLLPFSWAEWFRGVFAFSLLSNISLCFPNSICPQREFSPHSVSPRGAMQVSGQCRHMATSVTPPPPTSNATDLGWVRFAKARTRTLPIWSAASPGGDCLVLVNPTTAPYSWLKETSWARRIWQGSRGIFHFVNVVSWFSFVRLVSLIVSVKSGHVAPGCPTQVHEATLGPSSSTSTPQIRWHIDTSFSKQNEATVCY